jgi:hypothetical protein
MDNDVAIDWERLGQNGVVRLTARFPDGGNYTDQLDITLAAERERFLDGLCTGRPGINREAVATTLDEIVDRIVQPADEPEADDSAGRRPSQADRLVLLAEGAELFHSQGADSEPYATIDVGNHRETWPINSKGFRRYLSRLFYESEKRVPASQALQDALGVLGAQAMFDGPAQDVAVRIGQLDTRIYLDLVDEAWRCAEITANGWRIIPNGPIKFIGRRGMLPLPDPVRGGSVDELRQLVNIQNNDHWQLFIAWLLAALRVGRPCPILVVNGEQGSAKTTLCKIARALIDPNASPLRRPPRDERDLMIAAANSRLVALDNLSGLPPWLSDGLCTLCTGGGLGVRQLYTDDEERLFEGMRPILVNGIEDVAIRPDFLDRAISLTLEYIDDRRRLTESEIWARFEQARPRILGALLNVVSVALGSLPTVRLREKPRMADFAEWAAAAELALGWEPGAILAAYARNRRLLNLVAFEGSAIAVPIMRLMEPISEWSGTSKQLLDAISPLVDEATRKCKDWPSSPRGLSGQLRRLASNLRREGIDVRPPEPNDHQRIIHLERVCNSPPEPPEPPEHCEPSDATPAFSPTSDNLAEQGGSGGMWAVAGGSGGRPYSGPADRPQENPGFYQAEGGSGGSGGCLQPNSNSDEDEEVEWMG